ncbi:MAG: DUF106 domain-containing protein [Candidatus Aenigmarchaeota archaeon]|nr:DUF106 domain-containing protein [Candidatus Aenigmarchaeota archaeon]
MFFESQMNIIFAPLIAGGMFFALTAISVLMSSITTVFYRIFVDQSSMKEVRKNMETYREAANKYQKENDIAKMNENVSKMMELNKKYFSLSTKPLLFSLIIFAVVFPWMGKEFIGVTVNLPISVPFIGNNVGWFGWYFLLAVPSSVIMRKLLDVQ